MNNIQILESIGQSLSINQYDSLEDMLNDAPEKIKSNKLSSDKTNELVCAHMASNELIGIHDASVDADQISVLVTPEANDQVGLLLTPEQ